MGCTFKPQILKYKENDPMNDILMNKTELNDRKNVFENLRNK